MFSTKPLPSAVSKIQQHRADEREDRKTKADIRAYHGYRCSVCRRRGRLEVHEEKRRGAGGLVSLQNSYLACVPPTGACHQLLQGRHILAENVDASEPLDARKPIRFLMPQRVADVVFPNGQIPAHVHVVPEGV